MTTAIRKLRQVRTYRTTLRSLRSLDQAELSTLWMKPSDILRVARAVSRV